MRSKIKDRLSDPEGLYGPVLYGEGGARVAVCSSLRGAKLNRGSLKCKLLDYLRKTKPSLKICKEMSLLGSIPRVTALEDPLASYRDSYLTLVTLASPRACTCTHDTINIISMLLEREIFAVLAKAAFKGVPLDANEIANDHKNIKPGSSHA